MLFFHVDRLATKISKSWRHFHKLSLGIITYRLLFEMLGFGPQGEGIYYKVTVEMTATSFSWIFPSAYVFPAQFSERRENSHPETDDCWLVVGRARRLLWVHSREPPREGPGGGWPRGHLAGWGVLRQLRNPGIAFRSPAQLATL